eukprot:TRINITY_DN12488_c0_g1_i1.p1 TRINITY_DN12488_c0_g1~~TRINITY_DN12488_c0_g1_i1.p1  ORF type:complete len:407 (-),score=96.55 TRINITY_DN12488_c0_g1_i1:8-1228(-)
MRNDAVSAIFCVSFETHTGNALVFQYPPTLDLRGVEFKAMPSGSHNLLRDVVCFKHGDFFGVACFHKRPVPESAEERGVRMRSVGVLMSHYYSLADHVVALSALVQTQTGTREGSFGVLEEYFRTNAAAVSIPSEFPLSQPAGSFLMFLRTYGEAAVLQLWRAAVLHKRILLCCNPPFSEASFAVHNICVLASVSSTSLFTCSPNPLFYVNVADIDFLKTQTRYVAATTEKIFAEKPSLYDLFVTTERRLVFSENLSNGGELAVIQSRTATDRRRQTQLAQLMTQAGRVEGAENVDVNAENMLKRFFFELNNRLYGCIARFAEHAQQRQDPTHSIGAALSAPSAAAEQQQGEVRGYSLVDEDQPVLADFGFAFTDLPFLSLVAAAQGVSGDIFASVPAPRRLCTCC